MTTSDESALGVFEKMFLRKIYGALRIGDQVLERSGVEGPDCTWYLYLEPNSEKKKQLTHFC